MPTEDLIQTDKSLMAVAPSRHRTWQQQSESSSDAETGAASPAIAR
jgi:hypothetical protein